MKWDRLFLIVFANLLIAMVIITLIEDKSILGASFGFGYGIIAHIHYWKGGRLLLKLKDEDE